MPVPQNKTPTIDIAGVKTTYEKLPCKDSLNYLERGWFSFLSSTMQYITPITAYFQTTKFIFIKLQKRLFGLLNTLSLPLG